MNSDESDELKKDIVDIGGVSNIGDVTKISKYVPIDEMYNKTNVTLNMFNSLNDKQRRDLDELRSYVTEQLDYISKSDKLYNYLSIKCWRKHRYDKSDISTKFYDIKAVAIVSSELQARGYTIQLIKRGYQISTHQILNDEMTFLVPCIVAMWTLVGIPISLGILVAWGIRNVCCHAADIQGLYELHITIGNYRGGKNLSR